MSGLFEPAPAQDEREAVVTVACIDLSTDAGVVLYANRDHWLDNELLMTVSQHERIVAALTRPAQTEQRPVAIVDKSIPSCEIQYLEGVDLPDGTKLYAAPIAQPAPQPELVMPVALGSVNADYDKGWADHAAEILRLNAELLPSTPC